MINSAYGQTPLATATRHPDPQHKAPNQGIRAAITNTRLSGMQKMLHQFPETQGTTLKPAPVQTKPHIHHPERIGILRSQSCCYSPFKKPRPRAPEPAMQPSDIVSGTRDRQRPPIPQGGSASDDNTWSQVRINWSGGAHGTARPLDCPAAKLVGQGRLELPTSRLSSARSNQLSY